MDHAEQGARRVLMSEGKTACASSGRAASHTVRGAASACRLRPSCVHEQAMYRKRADAGVFGFYVGGLGTSSCKKVDGHSRASCVLVCVDGMG